MLFVRRPNVIANIDLKYNSLSKQINNTERGLANGIYHKEDLATANEIKIGDIHLV